MTRGDIVDLVARLDPGARVAFDDRPQVHLSAAMTEAGLSELLAAAPDAQVSFDAASPVWEGMVRAIHAARPTGPGYELDDIEEDGSWKPGRRPKGWVAP